MIGVTSNKFVIKMEGDAYNKSKRRDSGVIPFADENPFTITKLNSISELNSGNGLDSAEPNGSQQPQRGSMNRLRRPPSAKQHLVRIPPPPSDSQPSTSSASSSSSSSSSSESSAPRANINKNNSLNERRNVKLDQVQTHIAIAEDS